MSMIPRFAAATTALLACATLLMGCASSPDAPEEPPTQPTTAPTTAPTQPPATTPGDDQHDDLEAAWLDEGRMAAIITWGSSSCVPVADEVSADGQTVRVNLSEGDPTQACTADFTARASLIALPAGVDPAEDVELIVTLGNATDDVELDGNSRLSGSPGDPTDFTPSAGWYDDELALLTWGSSSCPPIVESVERSGNSGTVTFTTEDRVCTMDMAPRVTLIAFDDDDDDDNFGLTLVGDNLDAVIRVIEN